jgi:nucleoside-diphosphate-sugar epimerase
MRVFVAGGTGVLGRRLVPQLVARGHQVTATTTSAAKLNLLAQLGADGIVMDGLDAMRYPSWRQGFRDGLIVPAAGRATGESAHRTHGRRDRP